MFVQHPPYVKTLAWPQLPGNSGEALAKTTEEQKGLVDEMQIV